MTSFLLFSTAIGQEKLQDETKYDWEKIVPLVTKRAEVEEWFEKLDIKSKYETKTDYVVTYKSKDGNITVWYGGAKSSSKSQCEWNVSLDTVKSFTIALPFGIPLSKLKYNLSEFEKEINREDEIQTWYTNSEKGIFFITYEIKDEGQLVTAIKYTPTLADKKNKCSKPRKSKKK